MLLRWKKSSFEKSKAVGVVDDFICMKLSTVSTIHSIFRFLIMLSGVGIWTQYQPQSKLIYNFFDQ